jgi:hypothetical protein
VGGLLTDQEGNPVAVFDLKTGSATLTQARINQIQSQLPDGYRNIPIIGYSP